MADPISLTTLVLSTGLSRLWTERYQRAEKERQTYLDKVETATGDDVFKYLLLIDVAALDSYTTQTRQPRSDRALWSRGRQSEELDAAVPAYPGVPVCTSQVLVRQRRSNFPSGSAGPPEPVLDLVVHQSTADHAVAPCLCRAQIVSSQWSQVISRATP